MRQRIGHLLTLLASALGVWVSITLMLIHARTASGDRAGAAALCGEGAQFDCSVAASSSYAEFLGIPIAALGFAFYVAVVVSGLLAFRDETKEGEDSPIRLAIFGGFALSLVYSIFLAYINATVLEKSCDKCLLLYGFNLVGYFASGYWAGKGPVDAFGRLFRNLSKVITAPATLSLLLTFAVALGGAVWQIGRMKAPVAPAPTAQEVLAEPTVDTEVLYREDAASFGRADAPIHIVEFSDFECPYCARFAAVIGEIKREFPDTVRVTFRNYPLSFHANARLVARGAVCANEQGNFWPYHDLAFAQQASLGAPDFSVDDVVTIATNAGLNGDELRDCVVSAFSDQRVERDIADGKAVNLRGTPTVFINGIPYNGPLDYDGLSTVIRELSALLEAQGTPDDSAGTANDVPANDAPTAPEEDADEAGE